MSVNWKYSEHPGERTVKVWNATMYGEQYQITSEAGSSTCNATLPCGTVNEFRGHDSFLSALYECERIAYKKNVVDRF